MVGYGPKQHLVLHGGMWLSMAALLDIADPSTAVEQTQCGPECLGKIPVVPWFSVDTL